MAFDLAYSGQNNLAAIHLIQSGGTPCRNVTIRGCYFTTGATEPAWGETAYAIRADNCQYLRVSDNRIIGAKILAAATGLKAGPCSIVGNHITNPHNYAIEFAGAAASDDQENLVISQNVIEGLPGLGGILIGSTSVGGAAGKLYRVHVIDNQISGIWGGGANDCLGILLIMATDTQDMLIRGNVIRNTNGAPATNSTGIEFRRTVAACALKRVHIEGNSVQNASLYGIDVDGDSIEDVWITNNEVLDTDGIRLRGSGQRVILANNHAHRGLQAVANTGDLKEVEIQSNVCRNANAGSPTGGIIVHAFPGNQLQANIRGNKSHDDQATKTQQYGILGLGSGTLDLQATDNDLRGNLTGETFGI